MTLSELPTCDWLVADMTPGPTSRECGDPAGDEVTDDAGPGTTRFVCTTHLPDALGSGWTHTGSFVATEPGVWLLQPVENHDSVNRRVDALVAAYRDAKGTADAKAAHVLDQLEHDGWLMFHLDDGTPVQLRPDEQVVTVPDGHQVDVLRPGDYRLHGPAVAGNDELGFLSVVGTHLERMTPAARARCLDYLADRYGPATEPG